MNKILLLSSGLEAIKDFAGQPSETLRMAFIPAAGKSVEWLKNHLREFNRQVSR